MLSKTLVLTLLVTLSFSLRVRSNAMMYDNEAAPSLSQMYGSGYYNVEDNGYGDENEIGNSYGNSYGNDNQYSPDTNLLGHEDNEVSADPKENEPLDPSDGNGPTKKEAEDIVDSIKQQLKPLADKKKQDEEKEHVAEKVQKGAVDGLKKDAETLRSLLADLNAVSFKMEGNIQSAGFKADDNLALV